MQQKERERGERRKEIRVDDREEKGREAEVEHVRRGLGGFADSQNR